ncbi:4-coumarate--coa ligase [Plakobranchus ocellatus]|uniref:4-coumarate--coa ligase n=1 Tax=Plakobranchus ocellatus TaxID=259542 RepID=A0AAV4BUD8_9GAST|nr:4-coumarate--coa ligase [Plakobranchus ocellatus]
MQGECAVVFSHEEAEIYRCSLRIKFGNFRSCGGKFAMLNWLSSPDASDSGDSSDNTNDLNAFAFRNDDDEYEEEDNIDNGDDERWGGGGGEGRRKRGGRRRGLSSSVGVSDSYPAVVASNGILQTIICRHLSASTPTSDQQSTVKPDNKLVIVSPTSDIHIPADLTVHQMVYDACDKYRDKHAMEKFLTGRKYTYTQLKDASARVASALYRKDYRKGDVLLVFAANCMYYVVLMVACAATGVWFCTANPTFTVSELAFQLRTSDAKGICISSPLAPVAKEAMGSKELQNKNLDCIAFGEASGFQSFQNLLDDDGKAFPDVKLDAKKNVFVLPYSSGTTGLPKGVMLSHHNCLANAFQILEVVPASPEDSAIGLVPVYHIYGMVANFFPTIAAGGSVYYLPKFEPETFLECLQDCRATLIWKTVHIVSESFDARNGAKCLRFRGETCHQFHGSWFGLVARMDSHHEP